MNHAVRNLKVINIHKHINVTFCFPYETIDFDLDKLDTYFKRKLRHSAAHYVMMYILMFLFEIKLSI